MSILRFTLCNTYYAERGEPWLIIIDSLSTILLRHGVSKTAQLLNKLRDYLVSITRKDSKEKEKEKEKEKNKETEKQTKETAQEGVTSKGEHSDSPSIFGLVHLDVHQNASAVKSIEYLVDTVIKMNTPSESIPYPSPLDERRCEILNKRFSGRVSREVPLMHPRCLTLSPKNRCK